VLAVSAVYLLAHFTIYVVLRRALRSERRIFLYHFASASLVAIIGFALLLIEPSAAPFSFAALVLVLSVHGIYSLSFLELWSLAQGGYSLSVLASIKHASEAGAEPDFSRLERIGETKKKERIRGLQKLGLLAVRGSDITLTNRGRVAAALLSYLLTWIGAKTSETPH
jgi:hypothetical protein